MVSPQPPPCFRTPLPALPALVYSSTRDDELNWIIVDAAGRMMQQRTVRLYPGINTFQLGNGKMGRGFTFSGSTLRRLPATEADERVVPSAALSRLFTSFSSFQIPLAAMTNPAGIANTNKAEREIAPAEALDFNKIKNECECGGTDACVTKF